MRPELLNKNLDGYQIRRQLGSGGFADAFLATTPQNRQVALKILKPELALNFDIVREFATEAVYLSRLPHKHIVPFEKFGVAGQDYYIAMAYAPQGSLKELLQGNTLLTEKTAVDVITQTAEAVQYAHDNKILHRDIKPANLLLKNLYDVWVTDFGIAITAHHPDSLSRQQIAASLSYAAPEQLIGQAIRESDVYSLAVT